MIPTTGKMVKKIHQSWNNSWNCSEPVLSFLKWMVFCLWRFSKKFSWPHFKVSLSLFIFIYASICSSFLSPFVFVSICDSFVCLSISMCFVLSVCSSVSLSVLLSLCLFFCLTVCSFVSLLLVYVLSLYFSFCLSVLLPLSFCPNCQFLILSICSFVSLSFLFVCLSSCVSVSVYQICCLLLPK